MAGNKEAPEERFQILSLDGGGLRGFFSAALLAKLEGMLGKRIVDCFDLVVGTSTGGLIALALGLGIPADRIVQFYLELGPRIFSFPRLRAPRRIFRSKYSQHTLAGSLRTLFQREESEEDHVLGDSQKRLVIPSFNLDAGDVYLFKTRHHVRYDRDHKLPAWKIGMATTAAPTFFPVFRGIDGIRLVDGGVWANNPVMVGIVEAVSVLRRPLSSLRCLCVGTTFDVRHQTRRLNRGGLMQWGRAAPGVIMDSQTIAADKQASLLLGAYGEPSSSDDRLLRVDTLVPTGMVALDRIDPRTLWSHAGDQARKILPSFKRLFAEHPAPPFTGPLEE